MPEELKTEFKTEGQPAFPVEGTENDNSAESSTEDDNQEETDESKETDINPTEAPDQDKNKAKAKKGSEDNFDKHPRWKKREQDWTKRFNAQETRHTDELTKIREDIDTKFNKSKPKPNVAVPSWFGGDEQQWQEFQIWNKSLITKAKEEARTEAVGEINSKATAEQKAIDDATTYFNEQVVEIEADEEINPDSVKVDRNKLLKFVLDNDLVDSKGRWNYRAGFQMMKSGVASKKAKSTKERKNIASATTSEKGAETKQPKFTTSADFKKPANRPW